MMTVDEALAIVEEWVMPNGDFQQGFYAPGPSAIESEPIGEWVMPNESFHHDNFVKPYDAVNHKMWRKMQAALEEELVEPVYSWMVGILWDPDILAKLEEHWSKYNNLKYSRLLVAEMLSKEVIRENPRMNTEEPFMLLQVVEGCYWHNDEYLIGVAEMSTADNGHVPVKDRMYNLVLPDFWETYRIAEEIIRLSNVPTILMIWNFELDLFKEPAWAPQNIQDKTRGWIYLKEPQVDCIPTILIFHGELLSFDRIQKINGSLPDSELLHFDYPATDIQRSTHSKWINQTDRGFAVHLSRPYQEIWYDCFDYLEIQWSDKGGAKSPVVVDITDREEETDDEGSDREEETDDEGSDQEEEKDDKGRDQEEEKEDEGAEEEKVGKGDEEENNDEGIEVLLTDDEVLDQEIISERPISSLAGDNDVVFIMDEGGTSGGDSTDAQVNETIERLLESVQLATQPQCNGVTATTAVLQKSDEYTNSSVMDSESQLNLLYTQELEISRTEVGNVADNAPEAMELDEEEEDPRRYQFTPLIEEL